MYLACVLCLGVLATLLTTWVLHLYHKPDDLPMHRLYIVVAKTVLAPFNSCKRKSQKVKPFMIAHKSDYFYLFYVLLCLILTLEIECSTNQIFYDQETRKWSRDCEELE